MNAEASDELRRLARRYWAQNRPQDAFEAAWSAFDLDPGQRAKALLARLLEDYPAELQPNRRIDYLNLLTDREIEPDLISTAGWQLLLSGRSLAEDASDANYAAQVSELEQGELALTLLRQAPVYFAPAERFLTRLRSWLLLSGQWRQHPQILAALKIQMQLNGGAWPCDESERAQLAKPENGVVMAVYLPDRSPSGPVTAVRAADPVTRAVAAQYEGWPYPAWTRITVGEARRLPDVIQPMDQEVANALPVQANMLVAGCGTGRQAAYVAQRYPDAAITAIDVSEASLDHARRQCAHLGIANVRFVKLDLHDVAQLDQRFHAIHSGGVLHHLPDPERGFKVLADVLHQGGVMHIMVYNRLQRMAVSAAKTLISDLMQEPINNDLLRRVRHRFLQVPEPALAGSVISSRDFATLAGVHDLLLHRHEESFDVTRIEQALDQAGLRLLSFDMPSPAVAARYNATFPNDPKHRDIKGWSRFTRTDPNAVTYHYRFWCTKKFE